MLEIKLEVAYREACTALGEALVRERLLLAHAADLEREAADRNADPESDD